MSNKEYLEKIAEAEEALLEEQPLDFDYIVRYSASYRQLKALEIIARCMIKQTEIAEQSFKEAQELRDVTIGMMKKDREESECLKKEFHKSNSKINTSVDERIAQLESMKDEEDKENEDYEDYEEDEKSCLGYLESNQI